MTPNERELLTALRNAGTDASVADILRRNRMAATAEARKQLSSRLRKLRDKGLAVSHQQDGVNYWSWTLKGLAELGDIAPDTASPEPAPESPEMPAAEPDIAPDISAPELTEAERVAGIRSGQIPTYPLSAVLRTPGLPDPEPPRFEYEPDDDEVTPALVQESFRIRAVAPFARINDALFVLDTLNIAYCDGMPAYQEEIERIADYLRRAAA